MRGKPNLPDEVIAMPFRTCSTLLVPLLLALAAAALALGCARDTGGDAAPTVSAPATQTPLPTASPTPTSTPAPESGHSRPSDLRCEEFGRDIEFNWQPGRFAQWSPDGSRILFDVSVGEYGHPAVGLYGFDIGSYRLQQVVDPLESTSVASGSAESVGLDMHFDVSPDGSRIVYSTCGYSDDRDYEIVVSAVDGTETQRLTENESFDNYAAWSPGGDLIAFISDRPVDSPDVYSVKRLYVIAADGSEVRLVAPLSGDSSLRLGPHPPKWSPDGRSIAFVATEGPVVSAVYTVGTDGSGLTRIAEAASGPSWSPDGRRIALVVPDGYDEADLYTFAIDGSDPVRVVGVSAGFRPRDQHSQRQSSIARSLWIGGLSWSPDGAMILLEALGARASVEDSHIDYYLPIHFEEVMPFGADLYYYPVPLAAAWSPDGSRIAMRAFTADAPEGWRDPPDDSVVLYTIARDGTRTRLLIRSVDAADGGSRLTAAKSTRPPADVEACSMGRVVPEPVSNPGLVEDCRTLLGIRDTLAGTGMLGWSSDAPIWEWSGVEIGGEPPRVREIRTPYPIDDAFRPYGQIPAEIANLVELTKLTVVDSPIHGPIPAELGELSRLEWLQLYGNRLSGPIPPELGNLENLLVLGLGRNRLDGAIPAELGNLANLANLSLEDNLLSGPIPGELGKLENVWFMSLASNRLSGPIPPELGNMAGLAVMYLQDNRLSGAIPGELGNLEKLEEMDLSYNQLTGNIPPELANLKKLRTFWLFGGPPEDSQNQVTGCAPYALRNIGYADIKSLGYCE